MEAEKNVFPTLLAVTLIPKHMLSKCSFFGGEEG
jgi:hypothetical protein